MCDSYLTSRRPQLSSWRSDTSYIHIPFEPRKADAPANALLILSWQLNISSTADWAELRLKGWLGFVRINLY